MISSTELILLLNILKSIWCVVQCYPRPPHRPPPLHHQPGVRSVLLVPLLAPLPQLQLPLLGLGGLSAVFMVSSGSSRTLHLRGEEREGKEGSE